MNLNNTKRERVNPSESQQIEGSIRLETETHSLALRACIR